MNIVWDILVNLSQEDINRLYYKNNLYEFLDNESMKKAIIYILSSMDMPFIVPQLSSLPENIAVELEEFCNILKEYVYYGHEILDHFSKIDNMIRSSSVLLDTDSSLVSLDAWYRYVLDLIKDIDMPIKHLVVNPFEDIKCDEFGDYDLHKALIPVESDFDYNFYDDESIEFDRLSYPFKVIPQDGVRYSIINMMAYILETLVNDYMKRYCKKSFSDIDSQDPCLISMKNEYLFARLLLTSANKFYADLQELQEGNPVPKEVAMDIKGLPLAKNTLNPNSQKVLKEILYEDILNSSSIDQVKIIKKLAKFEKDIYNSLSSGEKKFYKPANIKSINTYDDPMRINGIKAAIVWNELRDEDNEAIDMYGGRQAIDILKINITKACLPKIEESHPDKAHKIEELMHQYKQFEKCIDCIAIPKNEKAPSWILPYVDYNNLIISNCKDLPIESVGIMRSGNNNTYTNILRM